jgi:hypothetical protein
VRGGAQLNPLNRCLSVKDRGHIRGRFGDTLSLFLPFIFLNLLLVLSILPDDPINTFTAEDAFPPPKAFGLMEKLLISHNTAAAGTSHVEHLNQPNPY